MKVVAIADLQGYCNQVTPKMLPEGDVLLIAGDLTGWGTLKELGIFDNWLGTLPYKHKIIVGGNHDRALRPHSGHTFFTNGTYLQDETVEIEGLKIHGSPMSEMGKYRLTGDWAFCQPEYIEHACEQIPEGLDVLITHGPPYGTLDQSSDGRAGSKPLAEAIKRARPRYHVFGHIHERNGIRKKFGTTYINAALCDERNNILKDGKLLHPVRTFEL